MKARFATWLCRPLMEEIRRLATREHPESIRRALLVSKRIDALEKLCASLTQELSDLRIVLVDLRSQKPAEPPPQHRQIRTVPVRQFMDAAERAQRNR